MKKYTIGIFKSQNNIEQIIIKLVVHIMIIIRIQNSNKGFQASKIGEAPKID